MKATVFLCVLVISVMLLSGCAGQKEVPQKVTTEEPTSPAPTQSNSQAPAKDDTPAPAETEPTVVKGSVTECSFLSLDDVKSVIGIGMKEASFYPRADGCSKSWIDLRTSMDASVALQVTKQEQGKTQQDLTMAAGFFEKIAQIGDYDTSWDKNGNAVNFGKGDYKFQVQCAGDSCSQEKAIALAKIVLTKTP